jgi:hypothetical protein
LGSFFVRKEDPAVKLNTYLHAVLIFEMGGAVPSIKLQEMLLDSAYGHGGMYQDHFQN